MTETLLNLLGTSQLAFNAVAGLAQSVEQMHETIARRPLPWSPRPDQPTRAHGLLASAVYTVIHKSIGACAKGVDFSLGAIPVQAAKPSVTQRELRIVAAVNGVCGDHLESTSNPLAIRMKLVKEGMLFSPTAADLASVYPDASPHLVVLVHGLCLSENSWSRNNQPDIGDRLHSTLGTSPIYLRYNTGRHISTNGREFADLLHELCENWPVRVESLSLLGHSMGGLVIRSACWYGNRASHPWVRHLRRVVCLGTPHHGSPLERAGHLLDRAMRSIQYIEPLALGRRRSAGIKDLRYGNIRDQDWLGHDSERSLADRRRVVPLLDGVDYYFAAASIGRHDRDPKGQLLGDLLVPTGSAVGFHADERRRLVVDPRNCQVFHEKGHLDLLSDTEVHDQIIEWFRLK